MIKLLISVFAIFTFVSIILVSSSASQNSRPPKGVTTTRVAGASGIAVLGGGGGGAVAIAVAVSVVAGVGYWDSWGLSWGFDSGPDSGPDSERREEEKRGEKSKSKERREEENLEKMAGKAHKHLNVFQKPLGVLSKDPMTGFFRTGSCEVGPEDTGNHSVAATLTDEFLDFSASRGNNLRAAGLKAGSKWCLCAGRWREALEYAKSSSAPDDKGLVKHAGYASSSVVPKVHLHATNLRALDVVDLKDLKRFAAETEAANASTVPQAREGGLGGKTKERTELAGKGEMTGRE